MKVIQRDYYLNQLISGQENGLIKVVTGIRRCGKSFLLFNLFNEYLLSQGVAPDHIIKVSLDDLSDDRYLEARALLVHIKERIVDNKLYYVLLDEVQMVKGFESVLNSLLHVSNADVYVTGSNSRFLSSDIITEFRGRGDEIRVWPFSFGELYSAYGGDKGEAWTDYLTYGGLPHLIHLDGDEKKMSYLKNLYGSVYKVDIIDRYGIKRIDEFDTLTRILASSIGTPVNPNKLSNTFKSVEGISISNDTLAGYLRYMQDAFVVEQSMRFDIKGKRYIGTLPKYYFTDPGLRNALLDFRQIEESHLMENIIYNELRSRGFAVDVGTIATRSASAPARNLEVDFVANKGSVRYYVQSALSMPTAEKVAQESTSLRLVPDSFKKIIITKDHIKPHYTDDGLLILPLFEFLLNWRCLEM